MSFLPIGPPESQETMFEEPSGYTATDEYPGEEFAGLEDEIQVERAEPEHGPYYRPPVPEPILEHGVVSAEAAHSEPVIEAAAKTHPDPEPETSAESEPDPDPGPMTLTLDDFSALEDRVVRAVGLVRRERLARLAAEERAVKAEAQIEELSLSLDRVTQLQQEVDALRVEREQVRQRVERLLSQLDALEL